VTGRSRKTSSAPEPLRSWTGLLLVTAAEWAIEFANAELAPVGISWREWRILAMVDVLEPIPQAMLAERLGIDRTTASRAVRELRQRSLLVAQMPMRDLRRRDLYLSDEGDALLREAQVALARAEERAFARLGIVNWRRFHDQLSRLAPRQSEKSPGRIPLEFPRKRVKT
jgi:DNA-binding MarR family transcriptional regulator